MITFFNKIIQWLKSQINQLKTGDIRVINYKIKKIILFFSIFILILLFLPLFLIIRILSNFFLIRFGRLPSRRIGHFANDVNLYLCLKKNSKHQYDFFYLQKPISNYALLKVYKKYLAILPEVLVLPFVILNKINFIGNSKHNVRLNPYAPGIHIESHDLRDRHKDEKKISYFSQKDIQIGYSFLKNLGITQEDKFVCLLCRDDAYVKNLFKETYDLRYQNYGDESSFRSCNIENFKLVSEYLTELGYYVIRMGKNVSEPLSINNKKLIDYANMHERNDFLDIFLSSHCDFYLSTGAGLDILGSIFDRPIVFVNCSQIGWLRSTNKKQLTIFNHFKNKKNSKELSLSEIFDLNLAGADYKYIFEDKQVELIKNSPEEIKDAVIDMLELKKNNFILNEEQRNLHSKFWELYKKKINMYGLQNRHAHFKAHIGYRFLKKNKIFLE